MEAGTLDTPVQFLRASLSDDGLSQTETYLEHGDIVLAARQDISDGERWKAGEIAAGITTRFVLRWSPFTADLTPKDRLVCDGRTYDISGIKTTGRIKEAFEITCAARVDQ